MIIHKERIKYYPIQSGDIGGVKGGPGPATWACRNLIEPPTEMFHFFIVGQRMPDGDRMLLESQGEGSITETIINIILHAIIKKGMVGQAVAIGCLSMYDGQEVRFFRPRYVSKDRRRKVPAALAAYGRNSYGFSYIAKMIARALGKWISILIKERRFRRLNVIEVPYVMGEKALICTVAPNVGYLLVGEVLLPVGVEATPNAYEQAVKDGILVELFFDKNCKEEN